MTEPVPGWVLAGGQSARMGTDKCVLPLGGEPLIVHALRLLGAVASPVGIAGGDRRLERFAPVVLDEQRFQGPLGGIVAALGASRAEWNLFVPVDVPFLPPAALERLLRWPRSSAVAVFADAPDHTNPLVALYSRRALPTLARALTAGQLRVRSAIEAAGPVSLCPFAEAAWFRNVNTPEQLAEAERDLGGGQADQRPQRVVEPV